MDIKKIPADGLAGLKENFKSDAIAGFLVFLLAMPLSLGIAKASEFPPVMGLVAAIVGGLVVSFIAGSRLTIKGPAAGLIVIVAGAVAEFGQGDSVLGWKLALGTIVVAGVIQVLFGVLKLGSFSDFFPASAVHGMLAAIGIIIFSKQIHTLLGVDPVTLKGLGPIALLLKIPDSILHLNPSIAIIGVISLIILFGMPLIKNPLIRKIPSPLIVLILAIPLGIFFDFANNGPGYSLVKIGKFTDNLGFAVDFTGMSHTVIFIKYVVMFALVGSIESLLTVKAIDSLDPYKRKSNYNKDLIAVGLGNIVSGVLGGLPMISEVARSSANVNNGAQTRWANFFHGLFLLLAVLLIVPIIEMIPNTALAAMLIAVGYRLASPSEFVKTYKIGKEQLLIFVVTVIITLVEDLLLGVAAGILAKILVEVYYFYIKPAGSMFRAKAELIKVDESHFVIKILNSANFLNYLSLKKYFDQVPLSANLNVDFTNAKLIDHTFMEQMHVLEDEFHQAGGHLLLVNQTHLVPSSKHPLASRRSLALSEVVKPKELKLNRRQQALKDFAEYEGLDYEMEPRFTLLKMNFNHFELTRKALDASNLLVGAKSKFQFMFSDIFVQESNFLTKPQYKMTVMLLTDSQHNIPDFTLEAEGMFYDLKSLGGLKDIDFAESPKFSKSYYLTGKDEKAVRTFFTPKVISFFEQNKGFVLEVKNNILLIYRQTEIQNVEQMKVMIEFVEKFEEVLS